jgi:hypothetical protein
LKDYVDVYYLLEKKSLDEMTAAYMTKYPNVIPEMINASLLYHQEIDLKVPINLISKETFDFEKIKERLYAAVQHPGKIFSLTQELTNDQQRNKIDELKNDSLKQKPSIEDDERELQLKPRRGPRL